MQRNNFFVYCEVPIVRLFVAVELEGLNLIGSSYCTTESSIQNLTVVLKFVQQHPKLQL